jgi:hypothetical protein
MRLTLYSTIGLLLIAGGGALLHHVAGSGATAAPTLAARLGLLVASLTGGATLLLALLAGVGALAPAGSSLRSAQSAAGRVNSDAEGVGPSPESDDHRADEDDEDDEDEGGEDALDEPAAAGDPESSEARARETEEEVAAAWKRPVRRRKSDPIEGQVGFW